MTTSIQSARASPWRLEGVAGHFSSLGGQQEFFGLTAPAHERNALLECDFTASRPILCSRDDQDCRQASCSRRIRLAYRHVRHSQPRRKMRGRLETHTRDLTQNGSSERPCRRLLVGKASDPPNGGDSKSCRGAILGMSSTHSE